MSFIEEIKAIAKGTQSHLTKTASRGSSLDSLTPEQFNTLASRLRKAAQVQEATGKILDMRKQAHQEPVKSAGEMRKLAYQQAMRELGFPEGGKVSAISLLFGDMDQAQQKLAGLASNYVSRMIGAAVGLGLEGEEA